MTRLAVTDQRLEKFKAWLTSRGAEIQAPTNEWEKLRFRTGRGTSVLYQTKSGNLTWTGEAEEAWQSFRDGQSWRALERTKRKRRKSNSAIFRSLRTRDGGDCFYCGKPLDETASIEHLVSLTQGGPDHLSNMVLAHRACNQEAGFESVREKIERHVKSRLTRACDHLDEEADLLPCAEDAGLKKKAIIPRYSIETPPYAKGRATLNEKGVLCRWDDVQHALQGLALDCRQKAERLEGACDCVKASVAKELRSVADKIEGLLNG